MKKEVVFIPGTSAVLSLTVPLMDIDPVANLSCKGSLQLADHSMVCLTTGGS